MRLLRLLFAVPLLVLLAASVDAQAVTTDLRWNGYDWTVYHGSGNLNQVWRSDHVYVNARGNLVLEVSNGVAGGVSMKLNKQYGTWHVRFRMTEGAGKYAILLWPQTGTRPEVDFAEDSRTDWARDYTTATFHPSTDEKQAVRPKHWPGDFTKWHTARVEWTANHYDLYMDGEHWARFPDVGSGPMHLSIQTNALEQRGRSLLVIDKVTVS